MQTRFKVNISKIICNSFGYNKLKCLKFLVNLGAMMMMQAILASLLAGLATGVGGLPVIFFKKIPERIYDTLLGFAAGVMLSAASFSLIVPAIDEGNLYMALAGIAVGAAFVYFLESAIPHLEPHFSQKPLTLTFRRAILLGLAITIHNFPEGLAVGVG